VSRRLLVFDSGVGGLTVAREIRRQDPTAEIVYVADDAGFPYGARDDAELTAHVVQLVVLLVREHAPDLVVIACNTASTLVLPPLRARLSVPVVGTVPAVKPAAGVTQSGAFSVIATPGTIRRDYTRTLIAEHAPQCAVTLVGCDRLAALAEMKMHGHPVDREAIAAEIAPAFVEVEGKRTDAVVLGCTHYAFLADDLAVVSPWPVAWIDSAPAIARRAVSLMGDAKEGRGGGGAVATSGNGFGRDLDLLLLSLGLGSAALPAG